MERIQQIFPHIPQFASPERLLLIDFWSDAEEVRAQGENSLGQVGEMLHSLRDNVDHQRLVCTEEQVFDFPRLLLDGEYDGVVLLPPLSRDRGAGDILSSLLVRQQMARRSAAQPATLFEAGSPTNDAALFQFWGNAPRTLTKQRDLGAFIIAMLLAAIPEGTPTTLVSTNALLSGGATGRLRETIQRDASLRFIIELGSHWPGVHSHIELAALAMETGKSDNSLVRLFKVPSGRFNDVEELGNDFQHLCRQQGGATQYGYVLRNGLPASGNWLVEAHHPRWNQHLKDLSEIGEVVSLSKLCRITITIVRPGSELAPEPNGWPILHPRQVSADGSINFEDTEAVRYLNEAPPNEDLRLQPGDVVIRALQHNAGESPLRLAVVPEMNQGWYLGSNMLLLRFHDDVDSEIRKYVVAYLSSLEAAELLGAQTTGVQITPRLLENLAVPVPDERVLLAFSQLQQARDQFREWAKQLQDTENQLLRFTSVGDARSELMEVSTRAQQRMKAAQATDTLSWRILNMYPHPLAFRWRTIEIQEPGLEKYLEVLRAAEICLAYTGVVGCVLSETLGPEYALKSVAEFAYRLKERPGTGITFGTWFSIIDELNGRRFRDLDPMTPFSEVTRLFRENTELQAVIESMMTRRNDMAHDRGPSEFELGKTLSAAEAELETLYESVDFLTRYPLRNISYARRAGRRQSGTYSCQDLVGDHPVPANRNVEFVGETPAEGLNLVDPSGQTYYIEPWLVRRQCDKCKHEETYLLDRYMRKGEIFYKSLEYGHETDVSDLRDELTEIGIKLPRIS